MCRRGLHLLALPRSLPVLCRLELDVDAAKGFDLLLEEVQLRCGQHLHDARARAPV